MATKGRCTICGALGKLTEDHVPPRSVMPPDPILIRRMADAFREPDEASEEPRPGHTAPRFATLCGTCNSERLGSRYDPALARFSNAFASWVSAAFKLHLTVPPVATVTCQPALVARAVVGHLLAAEPAKRPRHELLGGDLPVGMREYFLSSELALPAAFRLYVWPYPSATTVVGRGIGHYDTRGGGPIVADTIKFFPLAFAIVSVEPDMPELKATQIRPEIARSLDGEATLEIPLRHSPGLTWPERPQKSSIVLVNKDRVISFDRDRDRAS